MGASSVSGSERAPPMTIDKEFLDILICPKSHARLIEAGEWLYSTDRETRLRYPIRDGMPILLVEEAEAISVEEFDKIVGADSAATAS